MELTFDDFKKRAGDATLSGPEKVGFPTEYRAGKEDAIFADIVRKVPNLGLVNQTVLEIGPGCSDLALRMIEWSRERNHSLILVDSQEVLDQLPDRPFLTKFAGHYPDQCSGVLERYSGKVDALVCYSILHYLFVETNLFDFIDRSLSLLADAGQFLVGDIPNVSKRKRFFASANGVRFHQKFTGTKEVPSLDFNTVEPGKIDDSVLLGLVLRARAAGFDAYLLPQPDELPMANRREDLLICKP
jgi:hypothetical protein